ncbi:MAG: hypothetical protein OXC99_06295 [Chloroflexi bacterium]|nr:hypothetical protein [Chloroflexota bacterium]
MTEILAVSGLTLFLTVFTAWFLLSSGMKNDQGTAFLVGLVALLGYVFAGSVVA